MGQERLSECEKRGIATMGPEVLSQARYKALHTMGYDGIMEAFNKRFVTMGPEGLKKASQKAIVTQGKAGLVATGKLQSKTIRAKNGSRLAEFPDDDPHKIAFIARLDAYKAVNGPQQAVKAVASAVVKEFYPFTRLTEKRVAGWPKNFPMNMHYWNSAETETISIMFIKGLIKAKI